MCITTACNNIVAVFTASLMPCTVGGGGDAACERELVSCYSSASIIVLIQEIIL